MTTKELTNNIFDNRLMFFRIAILLILLYHQPEEGLIKGVYFYPGFVGVDVFLFFSGYGLCFSYSKYSLYDYYKRRIKRILPLYLVLALFCTLSLIYIEGKHYTLWDVFCNLTTLSYYGAGGDVFEWFLSSLFLIYLIFPVVFVLISKIPGRKEMGGGLLLLLISVLTIFSINNLPWHFETLIGRITIFILGFICYKDKLFFKWGLLCFSLMICPTIYLYLKGYVHTYTLIYVVAPVFIALVSYLLSYLPKESFLDKSLKYVGSYSLEIYVKRNCNILPAKDI
jgi:peptidoglycan/LPS O-acetylase OafA/YrhL